MSFILFQEGRRKMRYIKDHIQLQNIILECQLNKGNNKNKNLYLYTFTAKSG